MDRAINPQPELTAKVCGQWSRLSKVGHPSAESSLTTDRSRPDYSVPHRLPRFSRSKSPPCIHLTQRDIDILRQVASFRFLTRDQIQALLFSPTASSQCKRRLTLLYHNAYLDRLIVPLPAAYGASKAAYCLDRRGAELLAQVDDLAVAGWRRRDVERETYFLQHSLATNSAVITLLLAARARGLAIEWSSERELRQRNASIKSEVPVIPDAFVRLDDERRFTAFGFALELDRGTEDRSAFLRKVQAYGDWVSSGRHEETLALPDLRVLIVIGSQRRSPHRLAHLKAWTESAGGRSLFWFADLSSLTQENALQGPVWAVGGRSSLHPLIEASHV